ncbi:class I SAM-dependent methyltransferase [Reyranella sp. CPCC 100927]|uniref:class I SAM-dependent methyltransferase n=1 Tax=Reyranella sp. CPCC 100927 TaxID=2599616 RepID=UPI0011B38F33|nr:class I SAM-dependent methyltransferase [Reyranella sp. CPCC 100927]TWS96610.1 class I SAM-dependent methyltransferase [Reyranella sp. CPCC 100927]
MPADTTPDTLHADQVAFWSGEGGDIWLAREARTDAMLAGLGEQALTAAAAQSGEVVLDVGCGTGATSRMLARAVGPSGTVLGLDLSEAMMAEASRRAAADGLANVRFAAGDASAYAFAPGSTDLLFSRFGVMFFGDPVAAFTHLRRALKPRGRLTFLCWRPFKDNAWAFVPFVAAVPFLPPMPRPGPHDPGPFAFGDRDHVRRVLAGAGFADITIDPIDDQAVFRASSLDEAAALAAEVGPMTRLLRAAPEAARRQAIDAVGKALAPYMADGAVRLSTACWLVKAVNPS